MQNQINLDDKIQIKFPEHGSKRNRPIALNQIGTGIYYLREQDDFDVVYYSVEFNGMIKILTIRTPNLFINKTKYTYMIRLDSEKVVYLKPEEKISFAMEHQRKKIEIKRQND